MTLPVATTFFEEELEWTEERLARNYRWIVGHRAQTIYKENGVDFCSQWKILGGMSNRQ